MIEYREYRDDECAGYASRRRRSLIPGMVLVEVTYHYVCSDPYESGYQIISRDRRWVGVREWRSMRR